MMDEGLVVVGSNPITKYWMDIFHIYLLQKLKCLIGKTKIIKKRPGMAHFKEKMDGLGKK